MPPHTAGRGIPPPQHPPSVPLSYCSASASTSGWPGWPASCCMRSQAGTKERPASAASMLRQGKGGTGVTAAEMGWTVA